MSSTREEILAALRASPEPLTVAELAAQTDVHANTVRFHLDSLLDGGQVEQVTTPPSGRGRPATRVRAVVAMDRGGPRGYEPLAEALLLDIRSRRNPAEHARSAGRAWGTRIASRQEYAEKASPVTGLIAALDDLGFAPEHAAPDAIALRHCPFLELTTPDGGLVCAIHLGLMQGVLDGSGTNVERLEPFVQPDLCCAHLTTRTHSRRGVSAVDR
ncbi:helix-turn-helix transcriptional regulator [Flexivirga alba]|uniref:Helix-turn-helix transcriptional regulator n=1 Tax=Flexivirga alba TaxID=702742 RepID=A0ABW2AFN9_9MICO